MARVIPTGGSDQTAFFVARNAAADDALARLYMTLLARREERERLYEQQKELLGIRQGHDMVKLDRMYGPAGGDPDAPNPFGGTGAASNPLATPPKPATTAAPAAAASPPPVNWLPSRYPQAPSANGVAPQPAAASPAASYIGPNPNAFTKVSDAGTDGEKALKRTMLMSANAQAQPGDDEQPNIVKGTSGSTEFSAQSRNPTLPGQRGRNNVEPGTLKVPPRRPSRETADFMPIHPQYVAAMDAAEKKYGIPQGTLMTLYGYENGGGWDLGRNSRSSANGLFQFTDALRQQYGISDRDKNNPNVMIEAAARNLRQNANSYKQLSGKELGTDPKTVPYWVALHQFGSGDGPRIVHAALSDSGHMAATDVMLKVKGRDNYSVLVNNRIPGYAQVNDLIKGIANKALPWFDRSIQLRGSGNAPQATQAGDQPPRPSALVPHPDDHPSIRGASPRLVAAVRGGAELALPDGYSIRATSGVRHGNSESYHRGGRATDWQIIKPNGEAIPNAGPDDTGLYTKLARGVKTWVRENDPSYEGTIGYGGAFDATPRNPRGRADIMHYDEGGSRGNLRPSVRFSNLQPLEAHERRAPASAAASTSQPPAPTQTAAAAPVAKPPLKPIERKVDTVPTYGAPVSAPIAVATGFGDFAANPQLAANRAQSSAAPAKTPAPAAPQPLIPQSEVRLPTARPAIADALPPSEVRLPTQRPDLLGSAIPDAEVRMPLSRPTDAERNRPTVGWGGPPVEPAFPPPVTRPDAPPDKPMVSTPPDMWKVSPGSSAAPIVESDAFSSGTDPTAALNNPFTPNVPNDMQSPAMPQQPPWEMPADDLDIRMNQPPPTPTIDDQMGGAQVAKNEDIPLDPALKEDGEFWTPPADTQPATAFATNYRNPYRNQDAMSAAAARTPADTPPPTPPAPITPNPIPPPVRFGWGAQPPAVTELPPATSTIPSVKDIAGAIYSGRAANEWPMKPTEWPGADYSGGGNTWAPPIPDVSGVWDAVKGVGSKFAAKSDESSARQQVFNEQMKQWVQKKVIGAAEGANKMINDWRYGPSKVPTLKTDGSGAVIVTKPPAPATPANPNAPSRLSGGAPAPTGIPNIPQPPLALTPKNGAAAIPFTAGPVTQAPPISNPSGAKTIPGGTGAAPPMSNRVADPSSPTGFKYLTPAEMEALQPQQQEPEPVQ